MTESYCQAYWLSIALCQLGLSANKNQRNWILLPEIFRTSIFSLVPEPVSFFAKQRRTSPKRMIKLLLTLRF